MRFVFPLIILCMVLSPLAAEETPSSFSFGRFNLDFNSKQLEDGTQTDFLFGLFYTDSMKAAGEIKLRFIKGASNEKIWDIEDSLMTRDRRVIEAFLLPFNYYFFRKPVFTLRAGAGLYYDYNKLEEEGYFNDSVLGGPGINNAYKNDFTGHVLGPVIDAGISSRLGFFYGSFSFGSVPAGYMLWDQTWKLSPMMTPPSYTVSSGNWSGPYFYLDLDLAFTVKFISLFCSLLYEYSKLTYTAAGFDNQTGAWADVEVTSKNKTLSLEVSLLVDLGMAGIMPQIGYGRRFNEVTGGENYLLLGVKKLSF